MASGDALAKGARKCQFPPMGGNVTQEKWDKIFEEVNKKSDEKEQNK
jgi:hypothetical protein